MIWSRSCQEAHQCTLKEATGPYAHSRSTMDGALDPELFRNDGSFLETFRRRQQEQMEAELLKRDGSTSTSGSPRDAGSTSGERVSGRKGGAQSSLTPVNGKLVFSLKQKSRLAANALKLGEDDEDEGEGGEDPGRQSKKQKTVKSSSSAAVTLEAKDEVPTAPSNPEVKKVADKLASFVAKNGRRFEEITRQKNPGESPFRFLFDGNCPDYKYYEHKLAEEELALQVESNAALDAANGFPARQQSVQPKVSQQRANYHTPASALYTGSEDRRRSSQPGDMLSQVDYQSAQGGAGSDSLAMMEFYMKKAAREDLRKPPKQAKDEMPPPASLQPSSPRARHSPVMWAAEEPSQDSGPRFLSPPKVVDAAQGALKKGHHMGDYIPPEELEKFLAKCNDAMAQKAAKASADRAKIQADNVGHRLLSKMGWKEGEGLGSGKGGRADPVQAGAVKLNNLGVGAEQPGEVTPDDDIYEQYKKRMMLGYRFRPNPLNNPRKAYY
eukprot:TRINITY_DN15357_c0_g1_i1.p1 TRINITY_DN15357_c0_g1~~TRINITY_DN15357_c0_g1_i1.p1  ORF type:complete len:497 (+),score=97.61 TRINITY_DN15357_c0_g1_i1:249-1739(+)